MQKCHFAANVPQCVFHCAINPTYVADQSRFCSNAMYNHPTNMLSQSQGPHYELNCLFQQSTCIMYCNFETVERPDTKHCRSLWSRTLQNVKKVSSMLKSSPSVYTLLHDFRLQLWGRNSSFVLMRSVIQCTALHFVTLHLFPTGADSGAMFVGTRVFIC